MKEKLRKISSFAIVGILLLSGCLESDEAIGDNINPQAVVEVFSEQKVVNLGTSIQFDASNSIDEDGTISSYLWDFGDGVTGTKQTEIHKYTIPGEYIVSLSVTDDKGAVGNNDRRLTYITVLQGDKTSDSSPPHPIISARASVVVPGTEIELSGAGSWSWVDGSASTDAITDWSWDFGDGKTGLGHTVNHTFGISGSISSYSTSGSYLVKLTVTNEAGLFDNIGHTVRVLPAEKSSEGSPDPDVLTVISIGEPRTLDPAEAYDSASGAILTNTYETLVFYDRDSVEKLIPVLAKDLPTISNEGMTYTFTLRDDVTFHDGSPMDAEDVVFSINRLIIMDLPTGPAWMYTELLDKTDSDEDGIADSIVQIDKYTVQFNLNQSAPRFLPILAYTGASIVSKDWITSKCGDPAPGINCENIKEETMGTGAYKMGEYGGKWVREQYILMKYYEDYWRGWKDSERTSYGANIMGSGITDDNFIKEILIKKNNDQPSRILELRSGSADMASIFPQYVDQVKDYAGIDFISPLDSLSMGFLGFNHNISDYQETAPSHDFFTNKDIRKAFCYSFDYDSYITNIKDNRAMQPTGPIPKGFVGYNVNGPKYSFDPAKAEMHFKDAGVWDTGFTLTAYYNSGNIDRENGLLLLENNIEALNDKFDIVVKGLEWPDYLDKYYAKEMSLFFLGWGPDYADPHNYAHPFLHSDGHYPHTLEFSNDKIDEIIMEAAGETNVDKRTSLYFELADLEHEEAYFIWTHQSISYHFERDWVNGWYSNMMHSTLYYMICKA